MNYLDFNSKFLNLTSVTLLRNLKILFENEGKLFILYSSLKNLKTVAKKRNLNQNIHYSKSYIWNSFLENSISGIQSFYICPDFPVDIIRDFLKKNSEYLAESLTTNKN